METISRDGQAVSYIARGEGAPLVFVHGWCCDHASFAPQVDAFAPTNRVVALDLPGHGRSSQASVHSIESYAETVAWLCQQLDLSKPVVIGHSMGGMIAVEAAASYPDVFQAAVALDSPLIEDPALGVGVQMQIDLWQGTSRETSGPDFLRAALIGPHDDEQRSAAHIATMMATDPDVAVEALSSVRDWPARRRLLDCTQPVLCVHTRAGGPTDPSALAAEQPNIFIGQTVGAGHFIQTEVPDQVNAMLRRFLEIVGAPSTLMP
jgi:pimeloyl-ACP methyl ester carboxylesterase